MVPAMVACSVPKRSSDRLALGQALAVFAAVFLIVQPVLGTLRCAAMMGAPGPRAMMIKPGAAAGVVIDMIGHCLRSVATPGHDGAPIPPASHHDCCKDCLTCPAGVVLLALACQILVLLGLRPSRRARPVVPTAPHALAPPWRPAQPRAPPAP